MTNERIGAPGSIARHASNHDWPAGHTHAAYVYRGAVAELLASGSRLECQSVVSRIKGAILVELASYVDCVAKLEASGDDAATRAAVEAAAPAGAEVWPNRLGFSFEGFDYQPQRDHWTARRVVGNYGPRGPIGTGPTPAAAMAEAIRRASH